MSARTGNAKSMSVLVKKESDETLDELEDTRRTIESAEGRARLGRKKSDQKVSRNEREFAEALHREADQLYHSGDYESALVLYHRAANVYPRNSSHGVAARRTAATISSWNNPTKAQRKLLPNAGDQAKLAASMCPESAAVKASNALKISPTPASVSEVLSYFDNHKEFWQTLPSPRGRNDRLTQSRAMLKQLNGLAILSLKNLEATFTSGKISAALKIAEELLTLTAALPEPRHYQIAVYHYLSLIHVSMGRHDRATTTVSQMVRLSKSTGNAILFCRSLVTLGKVHLTFGHLEAAARAWQHLANDLTEPVPLAWLQHEIGRCYLETGRHTKAVEMAIRCTKTATEAGAKKWLVYGHLLLGQALARLGRFAEALEQLSVVAKITKDEGDIPMHSYVQGLVEQVTQALRKIVFDESGHWRDLQTNILNSVTASQVKDGGALVSTCKADYLMSTAFSEAQRATEFHNGTLSSEKFVDVGTEITSRSSERKCMGQPPYQERPTRSDEKLEDEILKGNTTFRIMSSSQSSSSSTASVKLVDSTRTKIVAVESSQFSDSTARLEDQLESSLPRSGSDSVKSVGTNFTYIIEHKVTKNWEVIEGVNEVHEKEARKSENEVNKTISDDMKTLFEKYNISSGDLQDRVDYPSTLKVMEDLDKKDGDELLEMLKNLLLDEENSRLFVECQSHGDIPGVSTDAERGSPRSCGDAYHKVLGNRPLYKHSLPASPRDCELETVSYTCETYRKAQSNST